MVETLEAPLLRVPFESLKRVAKDRKALVDDAAEYVAALQFPLNVPGGAPAAAPVPDPSGDTEMADAANEPAPGADASSPTDALPATTTTTTTTTTDVVCLAPAANSCRKASVERLRLLLSQLQGVKRKLADVSRSESDDCHRCKARLEHLSTVRPSQEPGGLIPWTRRRLDVILVDHLLRSGHQDTATRLAAASGITLLTDAHIFVGARRVVSALLDAHDCAPALAWCAENRSRLTKARSPLPFKLHLQQFIELVRRDERRAAITYARANLAQWAGQHMAELQRAVATLAFTPRTRCAVYQALFHDAQWRTLADLFLRDLYRLHALTPESLLNVHLQAGLSALKTPASGEPGGSREDPLRLPAFQRLAAQLPYSKHMHSKLVCAVTREIMSDANPPVVLPNGVVYSQRGVDQLMAQQQAAQSAGAPQGPGAGQPGSWGTCPATGLVFRREELRRAFIA